MCSPGLSSPHQAGMRDVNQVDLKPEMFVLESAFLGA